MNLLRWWRDLFPPEKSVLALRDLLREPDDAELLHADGRSKRARLTRFPEPDKAKLAIRRGSVEQMRRVK
jgi:hypothetical protein